jgi:hypothetical protein
MDGWRSTCLGRWVRALTGEFQAGFQSLSGPEGGCAGTCYSNPASLGPELYVADKQQLCIHQIKVARFQHRVCDIIRPLLWTYSGSFRLNIHLF